MASSDPSEGSGSIDPTRLDQLVQRLIELRQSNPNVDVDVVLEELDPSLRSIYRQPLQQRADEAGPAGDAEQLILETFVPDDVSGPLDERDDGDAVPDNATLEQPGGFRPSTARVDLPPASRKKRSRSAFGKGTETHPLPETIGDYRIKGELGRGAFGVVYLGYDDELQRNVAIKLSLVSDEKLQERLRVEASKVAQIESPGIVPVYHIGKTETGAVYIVQKYIEGSSLRSVLEQKGTLSPARAAQLLREIALGLEPAHAMDILHRDLKPDNVLIDRNGKAWIADFGLAISEEEQVDRRRELAGTPPYMSPEQIQGRVDFLDPRSDLWALGVIFYELLSGKLPFKGKSRQSLTDQICELDPRPLQQRAPELLTEEMNDLFLRCCAKKPADRFTSARELAIALDELIATGLSEQNLSGDVITAEGDAGTHDYDTTGSKFGSERGSTRVDTQTDSTRRSTQRDSRLSAESSIMGASPWIGRLVNRVAVVIGVIAISVFASYGYQRFSRPVADTAEKEATDSDGTSSVVNESTAIGVANVPPTVDQAANTKPSVDADPPEDVSPILSTDPEPAPPPMIDADGSVEKPWIVALDDSGSHRTIQAAVDAGPEDAHIHIMPGIYTESVQIKTAASLTGIGESGECEIEGVDNPPLSIDCDGRTVTLRNLKIDAKGHRTTKEFNAVDVKSGTLVLYSSQLETRSFNCVKALQGTRVAVVDCEFLDSKQFAISTKDHDTITVRDCVFHQSGIQLVGGPASIERSEFFGHEGVYAERSGETPVRVLDCLFEECSDYGIVATTASNVAVETSTFRLCNYGTKAGLAVDDKESEDAILKSGRVTIDHSTFENCNYAISADDASEIIAKNNCMVSGGKWGVAVTSGTVRVTDLQIRDTSDGGMLCVANGNIFATNVQIQQAGLYGVKMDGGTLTYEGGLVEGCSVMGVSFEKDCLGGSIDSVKLVNHPQAGIGVSSGPLKLSNVSISGSDVGIFAQSEESEITAIRVENSTFQEIGKYAVYARGTVDVELKDCDFTDVPADRHTKTVEQGAIDVIQE